MVHGMHAIYICLFEKIIMNFVYFVSNWWFLCTIRLFNYGIGIHLLQSEDPESMTKKTEINPKDNHISFQVLIVGFHSQNFNTC